MNLVRNRFAPALTLTLGLLVAAGCKPDKPAGTTNPPGEGGGAMADAGGDGGDGGEEGTETAAGDGGGEGGAAAGDGGGAAKTCEPQVADTPTPLFGEKVLIRPPINVELQEENPTKATTYASAGFVSACDATVDKMWVLIFEANEQNKNLTKFMDDFIGSYLSKVGFANGERSENYVESDTALHTSVEYPAADGNPPATLYIGLTYQQGRVFAIVFQTRPDEFALLKPTFQESAQRLFVVPEDA